MRGLWLIGTIGYSVQALHDTLALWRVLCRPEQQKHPFAEGELVLCGSISCALSTVVFPDDLNMTRLIGHCKLFQGTDYVDLKKGICISSLAFVCLH
jgi:hypothetical protein